jgi:hypothetical protein
MYVLESLGAGLEEKVAGLLHDIPHTAFSHTVDLLYPNEHHNYHEAFHADRALGSEIPAILRRHGIPLQAAVEPERYPLLEQPLPGLCADRIDYSLRDIVGSGLATGDEAAAFLRHLVPASGEIAVDAAELALWFARLFSQANTTLWAGPQQAGAYWALAGAIRRAMEVGTFTHDDLFLTDDQAMSRLAESDDHILSAYLALLAPSTIFHCTCEGGPYFEARMKWRAVDPLVLEAGWQQPRCLSSLSEEYRRELAAAHLKKEAVYRLWSDAITPELARAVAQGQGSPDK